ncbi:permease component of transport system for ferric iron, partial [Escherichia coli N1]
FCGTAQRH